MARYPKSELPAAPPQLAAGKRGPAPLGRDRNKLDRPPSFMSIASLALELDVPQKEIAKMVERGVLPKPAVWPGNIVRFEWEQVQAALGSAAGGSIVIDDPYVAGARNATAAR